MTLTTVGGWPRRVSCCRPGWKGSRKALILMFPTLSTPPPPARPEAMEAFAADPLSKKVFGDAMFAVSVDYNRAEREIFQSSLSPLGTGS